MIFTNLANSRKNWDARLLVANILGAIIYVVRASHGWVIPQECAIGINSITGEPFVWAFEIFHVVALFALVDLWWAWRIVSKRQRGSGWWLLASAGVWTIAIIVDFAHHQC